MSLTVNEKSLISSARSTATVMLSTFMSRILGFVRIGIISALFGAGGQADILHLVFNIPNNLRKLLAEGALSTAFIPVLSKSLVEDPGRLQSKKIVQNLFAVQLLIILPLLILSVAFPRAITSVLLNFRDAESQILAADLFARLIHYILLISFSAVIMATLNSNDKFVVPGLTPLLFSISVIISLLLFHGKIGIYSMVVGVIVGGFAQLLFQLPQFYKLGYRFAFDFGFGNKEFKTILRNWIPVLTTSAVFAINQQIAARFASEMEAGSGTAMSNAIVFWQLPYGIFSASIVTVLFPRMSRQIAAGNRIGTARTVEYGISALMTFLLPSTVGLMLLGPELISTALQRGAFTAEDSLLSAQVLFWYAPGLLFVGANNFLQRLCFSDGDIRLPVYNAVIITVLDIALSLWLKETALRVRGLALANSISYGVAALWLVRKARSRFADIKYSRLFRDFFKILLSLVPAVLIIIVGGKIYGEYWRSGSSLISLFKFLSISITAMASILGMFLLLRLEGIYLILKRRTQ